MLLPRASVKLAAAHVGMSWVLGRGRHVAQSRLKTLPQNQDGSSNSWLWLSTLPESEPKAHGALQRTIYLNWIYSCTLCRSHKEKMVVFSPKG